MAATYDFINGSTFSNVSSRTFSSIPSTYTDLVIQGSVNMLSVADLYIRFNGNASNYYMLGAGTTSSGFRSWTSATSQINIVGGVNTPIQSDNTAFFELVIPEYSNSSYTKNGVGDFAYIANSSTSLGNTHFFAWQWRNTAAINQVEFLTSSGNFNGQISIYGITAGNA